MNEIKALLHKFDEKDCYEFPSNFDADDLERKARAVFNALQVQGLSVAFEDWLYNQDASFGLAIQLLEFKEQAGNYSLIPCIRFSNFGYLVTILGQDILPNDIIHFCQEELQKNGFYFIPTTYLEETYDGIMQETGIFRDWGIRYFDYL